MSVVTRMAHDDFEYPTGVANLEFILAAKNESPAIVAELIETCEKQAEVIRKYHKQNPFPTNDEISDAEKLARKYVGNFQYSPDGNQQATDLMNLSHELIKKAGAFRAILECFHPKKIRTLIYKGVSYAIQPSIGTYGNVENYETEIFDLRNQVAALKKLDSVVRFLEDSSFDFRKCPLCETKDNEIVKFCSMHEQFHRQGQAISKADAKVDHWKKQHAAVVCENKRLRKMLAAREDKIQELNVEIRQLCRWRSEQLELEKSWNVQAVGRLIGAPLGKSIRPYIQPFIEKMLTKINRETGLFFTDRYVSLKIQGVEIWTCPSENREQVKIMKQMLSKWCRNEPQPVGVDYEAKFEA